MMSGKRYKLFYVIYLLALIEAAAVAGLYILAEYKNLSYLPVDAKQLNHEHQRMIEAFARDEFPYLIFHPTTGWLIKPESSHLYASARYTSNAAGLRNNAPGPVEGKSGLRVSAFGDSFTHGDEVSDMHTYPSYLEQLPGVAVVKNYGMPGAGPDQSFEYFLMREQGIAADIILFGFMSENINRLVSVFRPFYIPTDGLPFAKPRFFLRDGKLQPFKPFDERTDYFDLLKEQEKTLSYLGGSDWFYNSSPHRSSFDILASVRLTRLLHHTWNPPADSPVIDQTYNVESTGFRLALKLLEQFHYRTGKRGYVVLFPTGEELQRTDSDTMYAPLRKELNATKIPVIDLFPCLKGFSKDGYTLERGHYRPPVNERIAECIHERIIEDSMD